MNLHSIVCRRVTQTFSFTRAGHPDGCPQGIGCRKSVAAHHDIAYRIFGESAWYCTCHCTRTENREATAIYVYYPQSLGDDFGTTCIDCSNGVHH